ncbi:histone deacetylase family protein, partial [Escherichia coli]|nr:histone deacetylase family protein [Escherichia coli]
MTTALITHSDCLNHLTPPGHPERVARLETILKRLSSAEFEPLLRVDAPLADEAEVLRCHSADYLARIKGAIPADGFAALDADTFVSPGSFTAALRGVGGNMRAVDMVMAGEAQNAFVACRPPGHHAEKAQQMGFCLFGNVSIAAKYALDHHGLDRVAIVDFDVHHGNGTQDLLWDEGRVRFVSTHQSPLWPGSGALTDKGGCDNIINLPLPPRSTGRELRMVFENYALPRLDAFAPQLVLISAGFDAHMADPLAELNWGTDDFVWATQQICDLAETHAGGRVVSTLEGGYDL